MHISVRGYHLIASLIVGALIGYIGGPAVVLVVWAAIGLALGLLSVSPKAASLNGLAYGFALAYMFMVAGYSGTASLVTRLMTFLVFGVVGAICGALLALIGYKVSKYTNSHT